MAHDRNDTHGEQPAASFARRVLIVLALLALAAFLWLAREALLLAFAAVVIALLLSEAARPLERWCGLGRSWALLVAGLAIIALFGVLIVLIGAETYTQLRDLGERLPRAIQSVEDRFGIEIAQGGSEGLASAARNILQQALSWGPAFLGAVSSIALVAVGAAFFAADPSVYRNGLVMLFPPPVQQRVGETVDVAGAALSRWLLAQLMSMAIVGSLVGIGAWAIGLPSPLALGLFAGITEFIPIIGPIVGAVPALVLALSQGGSAVLWTAALFLAVQQLESNIVTPLITRRLADLPPALLLFAVVAFGIVFGPIGVILAAPLTMLAYVCVTKLWVRETLNQPAEVPGQEQVKSEGSAAAE